VYVHDSIIDAFAARLAARVEALQVGNGLRDGVVLGPLINRPALDKVERLVRDAMQKGAQVLTGGKAHEMGGLFYQATLLTGITGEMAISAEEIFGPVLALSAFSTEEEAVRLANDSASGLAAYFYSDSLERVWRVMEQLEYGIVGVNTGMISNEVGPFGGIKESGVGREGSRYGMDEFMELKYVCMAGRMQ
jgi:succinate-semialdehyde dehydrogenase/glutarate-semialdehyde dehydrogenase